MTEESGGGDGNLEWSGGIDPFSYNKRVGPTRLLQQYTYVKRKKCLVSLIAAVFLRH